MNSWIREIMGADKVQPSLTTEVMGNLEICYCDRMVVTVTKTEIELPEGTHAHSSYEFLIPLTPMAVTRVDIKKLALEKNIIYPYNPEQLHGLANHLPGCRFICINIDKEYVDDIARQVYGRREVCFHNDSYQFGYEFYNLIRSFKEEFADRRAGYEFVLQNLSNMITVNLLRLVKNNMPVLATGRNYNEKENIKKVIEFFTEHYNSEYSLENMARLANLSPYHFIRVFKNQTGKTPHDYLLEIKIEKARQLLKKSSKTITEIASLCGFNSISHFTTLFRKKTGVTPSFFRNA